MQQSVKSHPALTNRFWHPYYGFKPENGMQNTCYPVREEHVFHAVTSIRFNDCSRLLAAGAIGLHVNNTPNTPQCETLASRDNSTVSALSVSSLCLLHPDTKC